MSITLRIAAVLLSLGLLPMGIAPIARAADEQEAIAFSRDIRPILSFHCYKCHGPDEAAREADLRLDTQDGMQAALEREDGVAKIVARVASSDADERMPPPDAKKPLDDAQIDLLKRWVEAGAPWGKHWTFEPLVAPAVPDVKPVAGAAIRNPIDAFVQARLASRDMSPSPEASRETLIRRVTLDLTGVAPTVAEVDAFLADADNNADKIADDAYEKVVDRLLQSPAYGERMAWDWLDAARYADSNGYQGDDDRTMWPWRDWVVDAFNRNLPYDDFTVWQLAGDLLPDATHEQKLATGFCRNHAINGEGGRIAEENRIDYAMDMAETAGTVWLGLTMTCCRCHDHKFDPLTQRDYYRLMAFFNQTPVDGSGRNPQTPPVLAVPDIEQQRRTAELEAKIAAAATANLDDERKRLEKELADLRGRFAKVMVMQDRPKRRSTFVLDRGLYNKPGEEVAAGVPGSLPQIAFGEASGEETDAKRDEPANRLALARWLVADENPLTARVTVNRIWQQFFGVGLVKTTEDFGVQGEMPVQQDLLDWLAADFRGHGWDVKRLVRTIVTSHTYRQSSKIDGAAVHERDPENRLLARGARFRMPSWMIRDQALSASGLLVRKQGGPSVRGYQPSGVWEEATFGKKRYEQEHGDALYRRSLYTFWRRIIAPTMFFDNASRQTCTVNVLRTNTPLHSLMTLNDVTFVEAARALAERALLDDGDDGDADDAGRIDDVYRRILSRRASEQERAILLAALARSRGEFASDVEAANRLLAVGESKRDESLDAAEHAAWTSLALAVMNLDEALTKE